jgi:hypothetical protein
MIGPFFQEELSGHKRVDRVAIFSPCRTWRLALGRTWDWSKPRLYVVMVNPSDADEEKEDPTLHQLIHFATLWGYGGLGIANLKALVSSDPKALAIHEDPIGPGNGAVLTYIITRAAAENLPVLVAWGNSGAKYGGDRAFIRQAMDAGVRLICLGLTQHGHPKHPMARGEHRIPADQQPVPFEPPWISETMMIGHYTAQVGADGLPICARCDGSGRSPSIIQPRTSGPHDVSQACALCGGSGVHPNPFGEASEAA